MELTIEEMSGTSGPGGEDRFRRAHRSLLGPAWRYQLATDRPAGTSRLADAGEDPGVIELRHFFARTLRDGLQEASVAYPLLAQAAEVEQDPAKRDDAMLMVAGGLTLEEMSERLKLPSEVIQTWEANYFDLRDVRECLLFMHTAVICPLRGAGRMRFAAEIRLGVLAGPAGVRAVWDCDKPPVDEAERIFQRSIKMHLKMDAAAAMPISTEREALAYLKLGTRLVIEDNRIKLATSQLIEKCEQRRERIVRRELRAAAAAKREREWEERRRGEPRRCSPRELKAGLRDHQEVQARRAREERAAESPLARLRWTTSARPAPTPTVMKAVVRRQKQRPPRPKERSLGQKIPANSGRDHRPSVKRPAGRCHGAEAALVT